MDRTRRSGRPKVAVAMVCVDWETDDVVGMEGNQGAKTRRGKSHCAHIRVLRKEVVGE